MVAHLLLSFITEVLPSTWVTPDINKHACREIILNNRRVCSTEQCQGNNFYDGSEF